MPDIDGLRKRFDRKPVRYAMVSAVAVPFTQAVLLFCVIVLGLAPTVANVIAVSIGSVPSYVLNRYWVWGKRGRNHLWREVVPFWSMALLGLAFSTFLVWVAARWNDAAWVISAANLFAFGVLWVVKYLVLDALLFKVVEHIDPDEAEDEVDGTNPSTAGGSQSAADALPGGGG